MDDLITQPGIMLSDVWLAHYTATLHQLRRCIDPDLLSCLDIDALIMASLQHTIACN